MNHIEMMKSWLEALIDLTNEMKDQDFVNQGIEAITTLRTAIEQAEKQVPPYRAVKTVHEGKPVYVSESSAPVQKP